MRNITHGIRQGCPISALLYVLKAEVFGIAIKDGPLFFYRGGLPFLGLANNFFPKNNAFQTIFLTTILKNVTGFFIDLI